VVCFEKLSGMKINFDKSDMIPINMEENVAQQFAKFLCCKVGSFPSRYLGVLLHFEKLEREDLQQVVDKVINMTPGWSGKLMSYNARLTLLKACLASIHIYLMSMIKFPKWALEAINSQMSNFFRDDHDNKHKYHLSNWQSLCQKKEHGGMGVPDLRDISTCLLASWIQRYNDSTSKLWREIIDNKYNTNSPNVFCCRERNSSPFLEGCHVSSQSRQNGL
jgi:hypothetical protein